MTVCSTKLSLFHRQKTLSIWPPFGSPITGDRRIRRTAVFGGAFFRLRQVLFQQRRIVVGAADAVQLAVVFVGFAVLIEFRAEIKQRIGIGAVESTHDGKTSRANTLIPRFVYTPADWKTCRTLGEPASSGAPAEEWLMVPIDVCALLQSHNRQARRLSRSVDLIQNHFFHRLNLPVEFFHRAGVVEVPGGNACLFVEGYLRVG